MLGLRRRLRGCSLAPIRSAHISIRLFKLRLSFLGLSWQRRLRYQLTAPVRIVFIPIKQFLNRRPRQQQRILANLVQIIPLEYIIRVGLLLVKIVGQLGLEGRIDRLF